MSKQNNQLIVCSSDLEKCELVDSPVKHILVPYDDSAYSNRAFAFALNVAKNHQAYVTVITIRFSAGSEVLDMPHHQTTINRKKVSEIEKSYRLLRTTGQKFGISVKTETIRAPAVVDAIVSYAATNKADLIVMGTRSRIGSKKYMIGSVAMATSQKAPCPVTVVK